MHRFTVKGPGRACDEITAVGLDDAMQKAQDRYPGKNIAADATEVLYVCEIGEDHDTCQSRLL